MNLKILCNNLKGRLSGLISEEIEVWIANFLAHLGVFREKSRSVNSVEMNCSSSFQSVCIAVFSNHSQ